MEKAARLGWLSGERARLIGLANQFSLYICTKGELMNDSERAYARKLLEMINSVDAEGSKLMDDLRNDTFKEIIKSYKTEKKGEGISHDVRICLLPSRNISEA